MASWSIFSGRVASRIHVLRVGRFKSKGLAACWWLANQGLAFMASARGFNRLGYGGFAHWAFRYFVCGVRGLRLGA